VRRCASVQALHWAHDLVSQDPQPIVRKLAKVVQDPAYGQAIREDLEEGLPTLPIWMQPIVRALLQPLSSSQVDRAATTAKSRQCKRT